MLDLTAGPCGEEAKLYVQSYIIFYEVGKHSSYIHNTRLEYCRGPVSPNHFCSNNVMVTLGFDPPLGPPSFISLVTPDGRKVPSGVTRLPPS